MVIRSFGDKLTEALYHGIANRELKRLPPDLIRSAVRKLDMLNAAAGLKTYAPRREIGSKP